MLDPFIGSGTLNLIFTTPPYEIFCESSIRRFLQEKNLTRTLYLIHLVEQVVYHSIES